MIEDVTKYIETTIIAEYLFESYHEILKSCNDNPNKNQISVLRWLKITVRCLDSDRMSFIRSNENSESFSVVNK